MNPLGLMSKQFALRDDFSLSTKDQRPYTSAISANSLAALLVNEWVLVAMLNTGIVRSMLHDRLSILKDNVTMSSQKI